MKTPVAIIDARFSDPGSVATPWTETQRVLEAAELFWLTTVRADGRPHVSPLPAVWLDDALHFSTGDSEQKAVNLRTNTHVILTTGCNTWSDGLDIVVEGDARPVNDEATLNRLADAWAAKWDRRWHYEVRGGHFHHPGGGDALVFSVAQSKVLAFGKGVFTHTTYRF